MSLPRVLESKSDNRLSSRLSLLQSVTSDETQNNLLASVYHDLVLSQQTSSALKNRPTSRLSPLESITTVVMTKHLLSLLSYTDLAALQKTSRDLKQKAEDSVLWERLLRLHFPHRIRQLSSQNNVHWQREFKQACLTEYRWLSHLQKKAFCYIKEGDLDQIKKMKLSLENDLEQEDINGINAVQWAIRFSRQNILDYFFEQAKQEYRQLVEILLGPHQHNNDVIQLMSDFKFRLIYRAIKLFQSSEVINLMLDDIPNLERMQNQNKVLRTTAAKYGRTDVVRMLLQRPENELLDPVIKVEMLAAAAEAGFCEIVRLLLEEEGVTLLAAKKALRLAAIRGQHDVVDMLLAKGATVGVNGNGYYRQLYALKNSALHGLSHVVDCSQKVGATLIGPTDLVCAALAGHFSITEKLLAANPQISNAVQHDLKLLTEPLSYEIKRKFAASFLRSYIGKRETQADYLTSFSLFGHRFNFGYSKTEKLAAARALLSQVENQEVKQVDEKALFKHKGALGQSKLGEISSYLLRK